MRYGACLHDNTLTAPVGDRIRSAASTLTNYFLGEIISFYIMLKAALLSFHCSIWHQTMKNVFLEAEVDINPVEGFRVGEEL